MANPMGVDRAVEVKVLDGYHNRFVTALKNAREIKARLSGMLGRLEGAQPEAPPLAPSPLGATNSPSPILDRLNEDLLQFDHLNGEIDALCNKLDRIL